VTSKILNIFCFDSLYPDIESDLEKLRLMSIMNASNRGNWVIVTFSTARNDVRRGYFYKNLLQIIRGIFPECNSIRTKCV